MFGDLCACPLLDEQFRETRCAVNITRATGEVTRRSPSWVPFPAWPHAARSCCLALRYWWGFEDAAPRGTTSLLSSFLRSAVLCPQLEACGSPFLTHTLEVGMGVGVVVEGIEGCLSQRGWRACQRAQITTAVAAEECYTCMFLI